jgi:hypothetical protein
MDWLNPVEWIAWVYGRFFQGHPILGGIVVLTLWTLGGVVIWVRAVDKYKDEHSSKVQDVAKEEKSANLQWYRTNALHQPDPFPLDKPLEFQVSVLNVGNERARRVFGFNQVAIAEGNDFNYERFAASMFEPLWQQALAYQKLSGSNGREIQPGKDELGFTVHGPVMNEELKNGIVSQTKFVFLVMAMRYEDSQGEHELQVCRYLKPPFEDMKTWSAGTIHEGTIDIKK